MIRPPFDKFLMFDVESVGLHGEGFACGWVVYEDGQAIDSGYLACEPEYDIARHDDFKWVIRNVDAVQNVQNIADVRNKFWNLMTQYKRDGYAIVTDCGWPVETNFLTACLTGIPHYERQAPYPLYDVSSVLAALGYDPIGTYPRLENELPAHNPLNDARQSARVLLEALAGTLEGHE